MKIPNVFIICGVHNNLVDTKILLRSICESDYKKITTIIIDDGSTDGTKEYINRYYPQTIIVSGNGNLWWTGAMEKGINYVQKHCKEDDYVLTINNDCSFDKYYISSLIKFINVQTNVIVGSFVLDKYTKNVIDAGVLINWEKATFEPIILSTNKEKNNDFVEVDTLSTKGTVFPIRLFKEIGNFDKNNFPHYLSDYEFTCRARKYGYKLMINYKSIVWNDSKRTGDVFSNDQKIGINQLKNYLFSKKSKTNISDQIRFFLLYCPKQYRIQCSVSLLKKTLNLLSSFRPNIS